MSHEKMIYHTKHGYFCSTDRQKALVMFQLYFWHFIWQAFSRRLSFHSSTLCLFLQELDVLHEGLHVPDSGRE